MEFLKIIKNSSISFRGEVSPSWGKMLSQGMSQSDIDDAISEGIAAGVFEREFGGMYAGECLRIVENNGLTDNRGRLL